MKIHALIAVEDESVALVHVAQAAFAGADGVLLYSPDGHEAAVVHLASLAKAANPHLLVGFNLMSCSALDAAETAVLRGLDMVWSQVMGIGPNGLDGRGRTMQEHARANPSLRHFASVAYFGQPQVSDWPLVARHAAAGGFVPVAPLGTGAFDQHITTAAMSVACAGDLAALVTPTSAPLEQVSNYVGYAFVPLGDGRSGLTFGIGEFRSIVKAYKNVEA
jgi:hypothetical protein